MLNGIKYLLPELIYFSLMSMDLNSIKIQLHSIFRILKIQNIFKLLSFQRILRKNFKINKPFSFIQVGANDGVSHDELYHFVKMRRAKGIVIEPLPDIFKRLSLNYAFNSDIIPVRKAVHSDQKEVVLYRLDPGKSDQFPNWSGGIASLYKDHYKRSGLPSEAIIPETVPADNLMNIIRDNFN